MPSGAVRPPSPAGDGLIADDCSKSTVKNSLAVLVRVMEQAARDGIIDRNPARITCNANTSERKTNWMIRARWRCRTGSHSRNSQTPWLPARRALSEAGARSSSSARSQQHASEKSSAAVSAISTPPRGDGPYVGR
jgi:hypothetical protein